MFSLEEREIVAYIEVPGTPVPQGRMRSTLRNRNAVAAGGAPIVGVYEPSSSRAWKAAVKKAAKEANFTYTEDSPLFVEYVFYFPKPKSKPRWKKYVDVKPDLDNLCKLHADAIQKIVFHDDSRIVESKEVKLYCSWESDYDSHETEPHVEILVWAITEIKLTKKKAA